MKIYGVNKRALGKRGLRPYGVNKRGMENKQLHSVQYMSIICPLLEAYS